MNNTPAKSKFDRIPKNKAAILEAAVDKAAAKAKDEADFIKKTQATIQSKVEAEAATEYRLERAAVRTDGAGGAIYKDAQVQTKAPELPSIVVDWPELLPLITKTAPEEYPIDSLPSLMKNAVDEVAAFVQAPVSLIAACALSAVSVACQPFADVARDPTLRSPSSLYLLSIADSGERKSSLDKLFLSGIQQYEAERCHALKPEIKRYETDRQSWEAQRTGLLQRIKNAKARKGSAQGSVEFAQQELAELDLAVPKEPIVPEIVFNDSTTENLVRSLANKWPSSAIVSSEAGVVFGSYAMKPENIMSSVSSLNVIWDGQTLKISRKTAGSFKVDGARLTLSLQVQAKTLRAFFAQNQNGALMRGSGFLARFLLTQPESTIGKRPYKEPGKMLNLAKFNERILEILRRDLPFDSNGRLQPRLLTLSKEAKVVWVEFHNRIEASLIEDAAFYEVRDIAAKIADQAARIAALLHTFENNPREEINAETIKAGCEIARWHLTEARRFFGEQAVAPEVLDAGKLENWLVERCLAKGVKFISTRDILQYGPLRNDDFRRENAYLVLEQAGHVKRIQHGKRKIVLVNPEVFGRD